MKNKRVLTKTKGHSAFLFWAGENAGKRALNQQLDKHPCTSLCLLLPGSHAFFRLSLENSFRVICELTCSKSRQLLYVHVDILPSQINKQ